jgi:hypothetical protein
MLPEPPAAGTKLLAGGVPSSLAEHDRAARLEQKLIDRERRYAVI